MNAGILPSRYAQAIFGYATGCRAEDQVYDDLCRLAGAFARVEALRKLAASPLLPAADKASALLAACGKTEADDSPTARIVRMVAANRRADRMGAIAQAYIDLYRHSKGIQPARVTTPTPLGRQHRPQDRSPRGAHHRVPQRDAPGRHRPRAHRRLRAARGRPPARCQRGQAAGPHEAEPDRLKEKLSSCSKLIIIILCAILEMFFPVRRGSVAGYTTDETGKNSPKERTRG